MSAFRVKKRGPLFWCFDVVHATIKVIARSHAPHPGLDVSRQKTTPGNRGPELGLAPICGKTLLDIFRNDPCRLLDRWCMYRSLLPWTNRARHIKINAPFLSLNAKTGFFHFKGPGLLKFNLKIYVIMCEGKAYWMIPFSIHLFWLDNTFKSIIRIFYLISRILDQLSLIFNPV